MVTLKLKREGPGYYTGFSQTVLDGTTIEVEVEVIREGYPSNSGEWKQMWTFGITDVDPHGLTLTHGDEIYAKKIDAVNGLKRALDKTWKMTQWGIVAEED